MSDISIPREVVALDGADQHEAAEFVLRLGNALLQAGYPINQIRELLLALSHRLKLPQPQVYITPTAIEVTIGPLTHQHRALLVTTPKGINLGQLTRLDTVAEEVATGALTPQEGLARLARLVETRNPGGAFLIGVSYTLTAAAFACTLGGGIPAIMVAALVGTVTGVLALLAQLFPQLDRIFPPLAAFLASMLASAWTAQVQPLAGDLVTLAGLVVLLPGFALTVSLQELASRDLVSGTVRLTSTFITLLGLILGVALGSQLSQRLFGPSHLVSPHPLPPWTYLAAALVAGVAYILRLQVELRDGFWVVCACLVAVLAARGGVLLGSPLGTFLAALIVGLVSNLFTILFKRPAVVMQVPGLIMLVPGSIGFQSFQALFSLHTVPGIQSAFQMFVTAMALVYGIFVANLVLPSPHVFRRILDAATRLETALVRTGAVWRHDDHDLSH
jgi:uncharacterized membrane protein YjjP (DUF1212 family)